MNIKCKLLAMSGGFTGTISQALPLEVLFPILYFNRPCLRVGRLLPINVSALSEARFHERASRQCMIS